MPASTSRQAIPLALLAAGLAGVCLAGQFAKGQTLESAEADLTRGTRLLQAGDLRQAKVEFQTAVQLNPRSPRAYVLLGVAENQLGDFPAAARAFRQALRLDPRSDAAHYNLALSLLRLERTDEAIQELQDAIKLNPGLDAAQYNLGLLLARKGRFQESIEHLEAARAVRPGDPGILFHLTEAYFKTDNNSRALELAREAIGRDSEGDASASLGALLVDRGLYEEAIPALEKGRTFAPESMELATLLARAYLGADRPTEALKLLESQPNRQSSWQIPYLQGLGYIATRQPEPAAQSFREALRLKPDEPTLHFSLGSLLLKSTDEVRQKAGVEEIRQAIHLNPHGTEYYVILGRRLLDVYQLQAAADLMRRALSNVPPSAELYLMLGLAEAELRGARAAMPSVQKAVELNPQAALAFNILGNLYLRLGDDESAAKSYKRAVELTLRNDLYLYDVAVALERLNRVSEAVAFAEKAVRLKPDRSLNHYMLGKLYAKLNRATEAVRELEACVQLDPKIEYPYYLLARTYIRLGDPGKAQEWNRRLEGLKEEKDRAVGLLPPASESHRLLDSTILPWETSGSGPPRSEGSPP